MSIYRNKDCAWFYVFRFQCHALNKKKKVDNKLQKKFISFFLIIYLNILCIELVNLNNGQMMIFDFTIWHTIQSSTQSSPYRE